MFNHPDFPRWVRQSHENKCRYIIVRRSKLSGPYWIGVPPEMNPRDALWMLSPTRGADAETLLYEIDEDGYVLPADFATLKSPVRRTALERLMGDDGE